MELSRLPKLKSGDTSHGNDQPPGFDNHAATIVVGGV